MRKNLANWYKLGRFQAPHYAIALDDQVSITYLLQCSSIYLLCAFCDVQISQFMHLFEQVEYLGKCYLPLPYVQFINYAIILYSMLFPFGIYAHLGVYTPIACFLLGVMLFTIEEIAIELEDPFGEDPNDLDIEKQVRRIDKETAW